MDIFLEICRLAGRYIEPQELGPNVDSVISILKKRPEGQPLKLNEIERAALQGLWNSSIKEDKKDLRDLVESLHYGASTGELNGINYKDALPVSVQNDTPTLSPNDLFSFDSQLNNQSKITRRELLEKAIKHCATYPALYDHLLSGPWDFCKKLEPSLTALLKGAWQFGKGNLVAAKEYFSSCLASGDREIALHCLLNSLAGGGEDRALIETADRHRALMENRWQSRAEEANAFFRLGEVSAANEVVHEIRDHIARMNIPFREGAEEIRRAQKNKAVSREKECDIYSDDYARRLWWTYFNVFTQFSEYQNSDKQSAETYIRLMSSVLSVDAAIDRVVDFGAFCGYIDYCIAQQYPNVEFYGVDRNPNIKELNDLYLSRKNLRYVAGDMIKELDKVFEGARRGCLFHTRTATMVYPDFLRMLYKSCAALGVTYVVLSEPIAFSRELMAYPDLNNMPEESHVMRGQMFVHNYKGLLEEAGYRVISQRAWKLNQLLDNRNLEGSVSMVAQLACAS